MMENKKYINEPDKQHLLPSLFFYVFALFSWQYVYSHKRWLPSRPGASRLVYQKPTAPMFGDLSHSLLGRPKSLYIHKRRNFWDSFIVVYFLFGKLPFQSNVVCISHILLRVIILIDRPTMEVWRFEHFFQNIKKTGNRSSGIQARFTRIHQRP